MNNQYAVLISSEIPELGELDLLRSIYRELNGYMEDYNNQINLDDLGDWKLLIQINLRNTNGGIGIFKRAKRFPSNKEFEISISIPVPNLEEARYGISDMTGIYIPLFKFRKYSNNVIKKAKEFDNSMIITILMSPDKRYSTL